MVYDLNHLLSNGAMEFGPPSNALQPYLRVVFFQTCLEGDFKWYSSNTYYFGTQWLSSLYRQVLWNWGFEYLLHAIRDGER